MMRAGRRGSNSPAVKCITFDLDDTLWACAPVIERAEQALYEWLGARYPRICEAYTLEDLREQRKALLKARADLRHDMTALRRHWLVQLAEEADYSRAMVEPAVEYFRLHRNRVTLFEEATPLLTRLRQCYTIGAITNGNAQVDLIGADHLFDFIVYSADAGVAKPDPAIFRRALTVAGAKPTAAVHVGDDPTTDVLGAGGAGIRTVWYNPELKSWPGGPRPDAVIHSLTELEEVLTHWSLDVRAG
ncbi:MAG TPA: HAD family hydrolase [Gammaproteobacteria bacterium]|nr:HAD family hydrolase [Gammaproteobacteria bacterium]